MSRRELSEAQLLALERWARQLPEREKGEDVVLVVAELRALREREGATRWLSELDQEI